MKILYSLTCHTATDCVIDQLLNFAYFSEDCSFVIHVNETAQSIFDDLAVIDWGVYPSLYGRVWLNPTRFDTGKASFCLHRAHYANYLYSVANKLAFDYFVLEASNSQFIRSGVETYMGRFDCGINMAKPDPYWREHIISHDALEEYVLKYLGVSLKVDDSKIKGCHEGMFFSKKVADDVFNKIFMLDDFCKTRSDHARYPTEEVWFQIAVLQILSSMPMRTGHTITYMPWDRQLTWNIPQVEGAIQGAAIPENRFVIKRIERTINDPVRKFLREKFSCYARS